MEKENAACARCRRLKMDCYYTVVETGKSASAYTRTSLISLCVRHGFHSSMMLDAMMLVCLLNQ